MEVMFDGANGINKVIEINKMNNKQGLLIGGSFEGVVKFLISVDGGSNWVNEMDGEEALKISTTGYFALNQRHCWLKVDLSECTNYSQLIVEVE